MNLYIVEIGDNIFSYDYIGNKLSLIQLNNNDKLSLFPRLSNVDYQMVKNNGGTVLYKKNNLIYWLINIEHPVGKNLGIISSKEITNIINNIINSINRDIKLNFIIDKNDK
jgi:hypothetical protein